MVPNTCYKQFRDCSEPEDKEEMGTKEKSEKLKYYKVSCLKERTAPQVFPERTDKDTQGS